MKRIARIAGLGALTWVGQQLIDTATKKIPTWQRSNYRGTNVSLAGGAGAAIGSVLAGMSIPGAQLRTAAVISTAAAGVTGYLDDMDPNPQRARGLRGHIGALARGKITTGAVKLIGISGAALVSGALIAKHHNSRGMWFVADTFTTGALIAGSANLINLFDLRPGRGLKVSAAMACATALGGNKPSRDLAASLLGVIAAVAPGDLGERTMLGDLGANPIGAGIGLAVGMGAQRRTRLVALAAVTGMIALSEKVSFTRLIDRSPPLSWVDSLGRTP